MSNEITNEDLAQMIERTVAKKEDINRLESTMATKDQVEQLRTEVREIKDVVLADHQRRIEQLENAFQAVHPHR